MSNELLQHLCELERELHRTETRRNLERLIALLHPDFEEFGRSGRRYSRNDVLREFSTGGDLPPIYAQDFSSTELSDGVVLLTYKSAL
jgi:hypothetical protein